MNKRGDTFRGRVMMNYKLISLLVLIVLVVLFVVQNTQVVEIRFLFWTVAMSRSLILLLVLVVGMAAGWLLHGYPRRKT
jgi:putative membrane protein